MFSNYMCEPSKTQVFVGKLQLSSRPVLVQEHIFSSLVTTDSVKATVSLFSVFAYFQICYTVISSQFSHYCWQTLILEICSNLP